MKGQLTIINLHGCDGDLVRDKDALARFGKELCEIIGMKPHGEPLVERFGKNDLEGYTLVQLIETSSIVVHLDERENKVFIDIFSCQEFDSKKASDFSKEYFKSKDSEVKIIMRG